MVKTLKELAPHEREVLENEFAKEELIQKRLGFIIKYETVKRNRKAIESLGGIKGIERTIQELYDSGLTPKDAMKMTAKEFKEYLESIKKGKKK